MHFWIDKRSQQCGFGRSRVAASLSGAGGGVGLGFGHPPRRMCKNTTTSNTLANVHRQQQQQQQLQQHHQHQQQQQQLYAHQHNHPQQHYYHQQLQHQQQQQQSQQQPPYAGSSTTITTTADCHTATSRNYYPNVSNNNVSGNNCANYQQQQPQLQQQQHVPQHNLNNNSHHQQQQPQQQPYNQSNINNLNSSNNSATNTLNNNNFNIIPNITVAATPTAIATTTTAPASTVTAATIANTISGRSARHNHRTINSSGTNNSDSSHDPQSFVNALPTSTAAATGSSNQQHYDMRSYHHPQFGNMSVRHYQHVAVGDACGMVSGSYALGGGGARHYEQQIATQRTQQPVQTQAMQHVAVYGPPQNPDDVQMDLVTVALHQQQQQQQTQALQQQLSRQSLLSNTPTHARGMSQMHNLQSQRSSNSNMLDGTSAPPADVQLLPSHLKCGMCASLVLASVFVAGAKFYFDHQGTGLEVLIFCAFSATFFLAACTVSLCRMPKGLMPHATSRAGMSSGMLDEHGRTTCGMGGGGGAMATTLYVAQQTDAQRLQEQRTLAAAHAGPPPYHIAILLPESRKEVLPLDESPPPSYDKILV